MRPADPEAWVGDIKGVGDFDVDGKTIAVVLTQTDVIGTGHTRYRRWGMSMKDFVDPPPIVPIAKSGASSFGRCSATASMRALPPRNGHNGLLFLIQLPSCRIEEVF